VTGAGRDHRAGLIHGFDAIVLLAGSTASANLFALHPLLAGLFSGAR
jgi:hypothetical protein